VSPSNSNPLSVLLHSNIAAGEPEVKLALSRLSVEIKRRRKGPPSPNAHDLFVSVLRALLRIRGRAHAEARMACLCDSVLEKESEKRTKRGRDDRDLRSRCDCWREAGLRSRETPLISFVAFDPYRGKS
jgi:hypothetical protein